LKSLFTSAGVNVEKIWFRSIAVAMESKLPNIKAKILTHTTGDQKDNKNAYVLLKNAEQATLAASKLNQVKLGDKHIRVDVDFKEVGFKNPNDFETSIFIGNLPFIVNEEDVRSHLLNAFKG